ncbi:class D sortase [Lentibacillus sediminis]|uniref:class D sortase n=1 Tax=Lentibacillus sediminis TaxID=1940529 RepID=UPI000C1C738C|nr:class D sortase [Lentibacillus sediminis]
MKAIAYLLMAAGAMFLLYGGYQLVQSNYAQNQSLSEARTLVEKGTVGEKNQHVSATSAKIYKPASGQTAGILHIPKLDAVLPIIEGTNEDELAKGVGHYSGTAFPKEGEQIVLSGHRDTVFRRMGELKLGDLLTIKMPYGEFTYKITDTAIVDADDRSVIAPKGKEVLTLTTCYPFSFIGNAPERYIITALPQTEN